MCNDHDNIAILKARPHPPALPHGKLEQVLESIFFVTGTVEIPMLMGCLKMSFSRNMAVIVQDNKTSKEKELVLVNSVRLNEEGLQQLDRMGTVKHVLRLGGFHGMDDPFYKERYPEALVWAIPSASYFSGFEQKGHEVFFQPNKQMDAKTIEALPISKANLIVIESKGPRDGILVLERPEGKVFVTGDSLQNMETCDDYFNTLGSICMKLFGFIVPCQVGPAWSQVSEVNPLEMQKLLQHKFDHVLPSHGRPVMGQAWKKYEPSIMAMNHQKKKT